jgi:FKBP-type peptidyl-prolyl cis-trans isomerase
MKKTIMATIAATAALAGSAFADANQEYIKTFGMIMYERTGLTDLKLTPEEFDVFMAGMKDAYTGKKLPENIAEIGQKMGAYLQARAEANIAEEAKKAEAKAAEYWKELEKKEGLNKTPTGLAYEIIEKGTGEFPKENSDVTINYTGKLIDGTVFDSTDKAGKPAKFNLQGVIPGFREGLQKVAKGGKARLYIPAKLGYGTQQLPGIPANSTLIFDVEILDVDNAPKPAAPAPAQQ